MWYPNAECTFGEVKDTSHVQLESLFLFASALGYEEVYSPEGELICYKNPSTRRQGREKLTVTKMIELHNKLPGQALRLIQDGQKLGFKDFLSARYQDPKSGVKMRGEDVLVYVFAGQAKIVNKVHATFSNKTRIFKFHNHKVEFMTKRDFERYSGFMGVANL